MSNGENQRPTVLVVDDEPALRASLRRILAAEGFDVIEASDGLEGMAIISAAQGMDPPLGIAPWRAPRPSIDIVISDIRMPHATGIDLLRFVRQHAPGLEVILVTAFADVSSAVEAMRLGAFNFLEKPFEPEELLLEVKRAHLTVLERRGAQASSGLPVWPVREGNSPAIVELRERFERATRDEEPVLVVGETGTGRSSVARAIHAASRRASAPLLVVSCESISESALETALFERGGHLALAAGGTLLLDDVDTLPAPVLQRLGVLLMQRGSTPSLARLIVVARHPLSLPFVHVLTMPALRDHADDLPGLARAFIDAQNARRGTTLTALSPETATLLRGYAWPGNLGELAHLVERAAILKGSGEVTPDDLPALVREQLALRVAPSIAGLAGPASMNLNAELLRLEVELIRLALQQSGGNRNQASRILGVNRTTLLEKMKRLGLREPAEDPAKT